MTYIRTQSRPRTRRNRFFAAGLVCLVLIVGILQWLMPHFLPALFTTIARPFWRMEFSAQSGSFRSPAELLAENEKLKLQLADDILRLQTTRALEAENQELKAFFNRPVLSAVSTSSHAVASVTASSTPSSASTSTASSNLLPIENSFTLPVRSSSRVLAAVLVRPPAAAYDEFIIDAGQDHGLAVNDKVYAPGEVLIGHVTDVLSQTSKVTLYSSPGETYDVLVGTEHIPTKAIGSGSGQYQAELPHDTLVAKGDFVIAPSLSSSPFAIVSAVITDPVQPFKTVLFAPPINVYQLRWVLVETGSK